jgi:hypothetical protein
MYNTSNDHIDHLCKLQEVTSNESFFEAIKEFVKEGFKKTSVAKKIEIFRTSTPYLYWLFP